MPKPMLPKHEPVLGIRFILGAVIVELRSSPGCPNVDSVRRELFAVLAELGLPPEVNEVVGDFPSPTVLVNGVDVMGGDGEGSAGCRLDLPSAEQIRAALRPVMAGESAAEAAGIQSVDCCSPQGEGNVAECSRRAMQLPDGLRQVHQAILRHFAATGSAPSPGGLGAVAEAAGWDLATALERLAEEDLVAMDQAGQLIAAYPFSPKPTAHRVALGEVEVFAMCAIDALGLPFMLGVDAVVTSTDPQVGQPVRVSIVDGAATYEPSEAVVVYAAAEPTGRSVDTCCPTINFFTSAAAAQAWIATHPDLRAAVLGQEQALTLGRAIFEPLLP